MEVSLQEMREAAGTLVSDGVAVLAGDTLTLR
jgi:hypothetical protein